MIVDLYFTDEEFAFLSSRRTQLKFEKMEQAILFYAEIADTLYWLQKSGKRFYAGVPGKPESYKEVGFEFEPKGQ